MYLDTNAYMCADASTSDNDYADWLTYVLANDDGEEHGGSINDDSNYTGNPGIQYYIADPGSIAANNFGAGTNCTAADITAVNAITGFAVTDLPYNSDTEADWPTSIF